MLTLAQGNQSYGVDQHQNSSSGDNFLSYPINPTHGTLSVHLQLAVLGLYFFLLCMCCSCYYLQRLRRAQANNTATDLSVGDSTDEDPCPSRSSVRDITAPLLQDHRVDCESSMEFSGELNMSTEDSEMGAVSQADTGSKGRDGDDNNYPFLEKSTGVPRLFICPITQDIMEDPVMAADGFNYERAAIVEWLKRHSTSPMTNINMAQRVVITNHALRSAIIEWKLRHLQKR